MTTKISALVDALGKLVRFVLLPGQRPEINSIDELLAGLNYVALIADKAFESTAMRARIAADGATAVIPSREGRKHSGVGRPLRRRRRDLSVHWGQSAYALEQLSNHAPWQRDRRDGGERLLGR